MLRPLLVGISEKMCKRDISSSKLPISNIGKSILVSFLKNEKILVNWILVSSSNFENIGIPDIGIFFKSSLNIGKIYLKNIGKKKPMLTRPYAHSSKMFRQSFMCNCPYETQMKHSCLV